MKLCPRHIGRQAHTDARAVSGGGFAKGTDLGNTKGLARKAVTTASHLVMSLHTVEDGA